MNLNQKFAKLVNAIKEYRGVFHPLSKKWIRPPKPAARAGIEKWCKELCIDPDQAIKEIDSFKSFDELRRWTMKQEGNLIK